MNKTSLQFSAAVATELAAEQAGTEPSDVKNVYPNVDHVGLYHIILLKE